MTRFTQYSYRPKFDAHDQQRRKQLGHLLRLARRDARLTQGAVALTLGYKRQSNISEIENGKRTLDPIELENFARLYGKSLTDFATWRRDQPSTEELRCSATENQQRVRETQRSYYKPH